MHGSIWYISTMSIVRLRQLVSNGPWIVLTDQELNKIFRATAFGAYMSDQAK